MHYVPSAGPDMTGNRPASQDAAAGVKMRDMRDTGWLGGLLLVMGCAHADGPRPGPAASAAPASPAARELPVLSRAECLRALYPDARAGRIGATQATALITGTEELAVSADVTLCRIDHRSPDSDHRDVELAAVSRAGRAVLGRRSISYPVGHEPPAIALYALDSTPPPGSLPLHEGAVRVALFPLTLEEQAVLVEETRRQTGPMLDDGATKSTLYRVSATSFQPILSFESTWMKGEADRIDRCELPSVAPTAALPAQLALDCEEIRGDYHDPDPSLRGLKTQARTDTYRWTGERYELHSSSTAAPDAAD